MQLIIETIKEIQRRFPENTGIKIDVVFDPESETESLLLSIDHSLEIEDAFERLDVFDKEWFAEKFINSDMKLNVTI